MKGIVIQSKGSGYENQLKIGFVAVIFIFQCKKLKFVNFYLNFIFKCKCHFLWHVSSSGGGFPLR